MRTPAPTSSFWQRTIAFVILFSSMAVLSLHAYLGGHTRLIADDFCSAYYARRLGLLRSIWFWYNNWSGRYTAFGADWLMERIGVYVLPIFPPLVLLVWYVFTVSALYLFLCHHFRQGTSLLVSFTWGAVFLFVVLLLSPLVPQSLYWWNAMRSYSLPLALLTAYAALFQIGVEKIRTEKGLRAGSIVSFLFLFFIGGLGETYVAFQLGLLVALIVLEWLVHKDRRAARFRFLAAGLLGTIAALLVVLSAPGNAIRQGFYPPHPDLVTLTQVTAHNYFDLILDILHAPEKLTGLLAAFLTAFWIGTYTEPSTRKPFAWFPLVSVGGLLLSLACLIPGVYATSEPSAPRSMIVPVFILVVDLQYTGFMLGQRLILFPAGLLAGGLAMLLTVYAAWVSGRALYDQRDVYLKFVQRWHAADTQILQAKAAGDESVMIPAMNVWTGPGGDPTDNPRYWVNQCYSSYYGITVLGPDPNAQQP